MFSPENKKRVVRFLTLQVVGMLIILTSVFTMNPAYLLFSIGIGSFCSALGVALWMHMVWKMEGDAADTHHHHNHQ